MLFDQRDQILCFHPNGGCIVIGMDADRGGGIQKLPIQKQLYFPFSSLSTPKGVTAPGISPRIADSSSGEAKVSDFVP